MRGVDVIVDGEIEHAEFGQNRYRLELADSGWGQLDKLALPLRTGATEIVPLHP